jgi:hypothetical protein
MVLCVQGCHLPDAVPLQGNLLDASYRTDEFRINCFKVPLTRCGMRVSVLLSFHRSGPAVCQMCFHICLPWVDASTASALSGLMWHAI